MKDVKVIPAEECAQQHHIVVCDLMVKLPKEKKRRFVPRIRTWKLRDKTIADTFQTTFTSKISAQDNSKSDYKMEDVWSNLKDTLLDTAKEVCGISRNHQWKRETW